MGQCHTQIHLIPRDMALDTKGRVTFSPIPEIASTLRVPGSRVALTTSGDSSSDDGATMTAAKGASLEVHLNCTGTASSGRAAVRILGTADGKAYTEIGYDYATKRLVVDHSKSSSAPAKPPAPPPKKPACSGATKPCPAAPGCTWCTTNADKEQCKKYCPSERANGDPIVQTALLAGKRARRCVLPAFNNC
jgi:hypothetical protein